MKKYIAFFLSICTLALSLVSCSGFGTDLRGYYDEELSEENNGVITSVKVDDTTTIFVYKGNNYLMDTIFHFDLDYKLDEKYNDDGLVAIHWTTVPFLGLYNVYYSNTKDNPDFYHTTNGNLMYLREDYDILNADFLIEGTYTVVSLNNLLDMESMESRPQDHQKTETSAKLESVAEPRLKCILMFYRKNGVWYAETPWICHFRVSDFGLDILGSEGILAE